jgi:hypothetical protein
MSLCNVRKWMHNKTFPDSERRRIQIILAEWGFQDVQKVRYKPTLDTIVVWPGRNGPAAQVFIKERGDIMYFSRPMSLNYY